MCKIPISESNQGNGYKEVDTVESQSRPEPVGFDSDIAVQRFRCKRRRRQV